MRFLLASPLILVSVATAQAHWTLQSPATSPPARTELQLASDGVNALLFGGQDGTIQTNYNDLWSFDGTNWTQLLGQGAAGSPPARSRFAMGFDPVRNRLVVYGGDMQYGTGARFNDETWEWDPATNTWTQFFPNTVPLARSHSRMAFDFVNVKMLMYGGAPTYNGGVQETWHWDGVDWTQLSPAHSPTAVEQVNMTTDWGRGQIVLFGGSTTWGDAGVRSETYVWDGVDWVEQFPATIPAGIGFRNGNAAYDPQRARVLVFGGKNSNAFQNAVWEWDGVDWTERVVAGAAPAGRAGVGMAYANAAGATVIFGGYSGPFYGDTWTWQTNALASITTGAPGCPTSAGNPTLAVSGLPWAGVAVDLTIGNVPAACVPFLVWSFSSATTSLAPFGFPACSAISQDTVVFAPGPVPFAIPNTPVVAGFMLSAQAAVIETSGGLSLGLSDVQTLTIGTL